MFRRQRGRRDGPGAASEACKQKRTEAVLAQMGYEDGPYNSKYKDAYPDEYQHISAILDQTSQKTQDQLAVRDTVAQNLAEKDSISLDAVYAKYDRYTATRDVIAIVGGTLGGRELGTSSGSIPKQNLANGTKGNNDELAQVRAIRAVLGGNYLPMRICLWGWEVVREVRYPLKILLLPVMV